MAWAYGGLLLMYMQDGEKDTKTRQGLNIVKEEGLIMGGITAKHLDSVIFFHVWFLKKSCLILLI